MSDPKFEKRIPFKALIVVPPDWDADKDLEYFASRLFARPGEGLYQAAEAAIVEDTYCLQQVVDAGIGLLCRRLGRSVPARIQPLGTRLGLLEELILASGREPEYLTRFAEDIQHCRDVLLVKDQTLSKYASQPEFTWLYELVETFMWLRDAAFFLDESLCCEHAEGEYKSPSSPS